MRKPKFLQPYESGDLDFEYQGKSYTINQDDGTVYCAGAVVTDAWILANAQLKIEWRNIKNDEVHRARGYALGAVLNVIFAVALAIWWVRA